MLAEFKFKKFIVTQLLNCPLIYTNTQFLFFSFVDAGIWDFLLNSFCMFINACYFSLRALFFAVFSPMKSSFYFYIIFNCFLNHSQYDHKEPGIWWERWREKNLQFEGFFCFWNLSIEKRKRERKIADSKSRCMCAHQVLHYWPLTNHIIFKHRPLKSKVEVVFFSQDANEF